MLESQRGRDTGMCPHGNFPSTCPKCQAETSRQIEVPHLIAEARDFVHALSRTLAMDRDAKELEMSHDELRQSRISLALNNFNIAPEDLKRRMGIPLSEVITLAGRSDLKELLKRAEERERATTIHRIDEYRRQARNLEYQIDYDANNGFSETTVRLAKELESGSPAAEELAPLPEKGTFVRLPDALEDAPTPVSVYERQVIRTTRDIESPAFSSCAAVVLFRERPDGTPEQETIFAHLPPKTGGLAGGPTSFKTYDAAFFKDQLGIASCEGLRARIASGLHVSPLDIARTLESMGAKIDGVEQIPLDMYTIRLDAQTKTLVARGNMEEVASSENRKYYTEQKIPIHITEIVRAVEVKFGEQT